VASTVVFHQDAAKGMDLSDVTVRFGHKLREIRLQRGISQEELAERAGLHRTYVSSVERGERNISLVNIENLARALGVTLAELMP
jgi:transcriptional regulator with XRE-family HTH domain